MMEFIFAVWSLADRNKTVCGHRQQDIHVVGKLSKICHICIIHRYGMVIRSEIGNDR